MPVHAIFGFGGFDPIIGEQCHLIPEKAHPFLSDIIGPQYLSNSVTCGRVKKTKEERKTRKETLRW